MRRTTPELVATGGRLPIMRCDDARIALSARLDDEPTGQPTDQLDAHLDSCALCQAWLAGAERVNRTVRVRPVAVPDLTARILAAVYADGSLSDAGYARPAVRPAARTGRAAARRLAVPRWISWPPHWAAEQVSLVLRWTLGVLAVGQIMLAVPDLLGVAGFGFVAHEAHAGREVAAFDVALAVGLLLAASYPEYARVFAPVVLTLVVCFASVSALDIMEGVVTPSRVAVHSVAVVQAALVWCLARATQRRAVVAA
jgi:predicted anti-sigma-YlaC factor YlaD